MALLIVATELDLLLPTERWSRLIAPLAEELANSGLGSLPDLDSLQREFDTSGSLQATEVAVILVNFDYGRPLVDRVVAAAGIKREKPVLPSRWQTFNCADYFNSSLAEHGYWDEPAQYWYIWPAGRIYEDRDLQFLVIGSAGVDGINWGYRLGHGGLWAWYPIDAAFVALAPTAEAFLQGWLSGSITV
jgi:hypothetical protein